MSSRLTVPAIVELQSAPLCDEAREYIAGESELQELLHLVDFVARYRFGVCAERLVEAGHAYVHTKTGAARNRSEAYDSITVRSPDLEAAIKRGEEFLDCLMLARSPKLLLTNLGLASHPSASLAKSGWDPIYRKIIYHSDPHSLYRAEMPPLHVSDSGHTYPLLSNESDDLAIADAPDGDGTIPQLEAPNPRALVLDRGLVTTLHGSLLHEVALAHALEQLRQKETNALTMFSMLVEPSCVKH